jgi:guanyl-specific ribonuclease Sa
MKVIRMGSVLSKLKSSSGGVLVGSSSAVCQPIGELDLDIKKPQQDEQSEGQIKATRGNELPQEQREVQNQIQSPNPVGLIDEADGEDKHSEGQTRRTGENDEDMWTDEEGD